MRPGVPRPVPLRTVHCGPCWAAHGGEAAAADLALAPPLALQSRDPAGQGEWLALLCAERWVQLLRPRTRERLLAMLRELAYRADWDTYTTWPTWARLMAVTGWARSTMASWLRQLRLTGWLALIESGSTPATRPLALAHLRGNRAAVYQLRVPFTATAASAQVTAPVDKTWTPTLQEERSSCDEKKLPSRAREVVHNLGTVTSVSTEDSEALRARSDPGICRVFADRVPTTRAQMLAAAAELRRADPTLGKLSARWVRALCRPYWRAGWTNNDLLHALAYRPHSPRPRLMLPREQIISPAGWARARLQAWHDDRGRILPGHSTYLRTLQQVQARFGRGGGRALPTGATQFVPQHLLDYARRLSTQAAELLARRRRREHADALARPRPIEQAASPERARAAATAIRAQLQATRAARRARQTALQRHLVELARQHLNTTSDQAKPAHQVTVSSAQWDQLSAEERYQRALQRARLERGTTPHCRRWR